MRTQFTILKHSNRTTEHAVSFYPYETDAHVTISVYALKKFAKAIRFWDEGALHPLPYQNIEFYDGNTYRTVKFRFIGDVIEVYNHRQGVLSLPESEFLKFVLDMF